MKKDELKQPSDLTGGPNDLSRLRILKQEKKCSVLRRQKQRDEKTVNEER